MTTIAFVDCFSGVSGDMMLGALIDAGVPVEVLQEPLGKLPIHGLSLQAQRTERLGITATHVKVTGERSAVLHNYLSIRSIIEEAPLPPRARTRALGIFQRLAEAEARVHGTDITHVRLHEVGSADTIVDVVGTALGLEHLGIDKVYASPVATGMGMMRTDHGVYPIPGPAVLELLKGAPLYSRGIPYELVTPTGAAILAETAERFGELPMMHVRATGYGAGTRELEIPNVLRIMVGEPAEDEDLFGPVPAVLLEANIDDMNPELYEFAIERLLEAGAQDAWVTPVVMKRGRPAAMLSILTGPGEEHAVRDALFAETTTIGMRRRTIEKWTLPREIMTVELTGGSVAVKVARGRDGTVVGLAPEYADCARVARETSRPLKDVYAEAQSAARERLGDPGSV
ncbi:MAG TPA: nickel pincer cofactor biosynthesis protein LarC [Actinomycetota bacterium]